MKLLNILTIFTFAFSFLFMGCVYGEDVIGEEEMMDEDFEVEIDQEVDFEDEDIIVPDEDVDDTEPVPINEEIEVEDEFVDEEDPFMEDEEEFEEHDEADNAVFFVIGAVVVIGALAFVFLRK